MIFYHYYIFFYNFLLKVVTKTSKITRFMFLSAILQKILPSLARVVYVVAIVLQYPWQIDLLKRGFVSFSHTKFCT